MFFNLEIQTFRGQPINDGIVYKAFFINEDPNALNTFASQTVETTRPGNFPVSVRAQPEGIHIPIEVQILSTTQDNLDQLKKWFNPEDGEGYLVVLDGNSVQRRMACWPERFIAKEVNVYQIILRASIPLWEANTTPTPQDVTITPGNTTFNIPNAGTAPVAPVITITPVQLKTDANSWTKRRRIIIANRSPYGLNDPVGDGRPIEISNGGLDTDTLIGAGKLLGNLADLRLLLNNEEVNRWTYPEAEGDALTEIWANLNFQPRKIATLENTITSGSTSLTVSNPEGLQAWPHEGFFVIDNECLYYSARTPFGMTIVSRGALNTTAAGHTAGATIHWVEHPFLNLLYDYSAAGAAPSPIDRKPLIDLQNSTNALWKWTAQYFNGNDLRSGGWQRVTTDDNPGSKFLRVWEGSGIMYFENRYPIEGKPRANNAIIETPCGLSLVGAAIALTSQVATGTVPVEGFPKDETPPPNWRKVVTETVYEYELIEIGETVVQYDGGGLNLFTASYPSYDLRATTITTTEISNEFPVTRGSDLTITTYLKEATGTNVTVIQNQVGLAPQSLLTSPSFSIVPYIERTIEYIEENDIQRAGTGDTRFTRPLDFKIYIVDFESYESFLPTGVFSIARNTSRLRLNVNLPIGVDKDGEPFDTIPEDAKDTGANVTVSGIQLAFDSGFTPKIILAPEESVYLMQATLQNTDDTDEVIEIYFPVKLGQSLTLDCQEGKLTDSETGLEVPFGMSVEKWPTVKAGGTNFEFLETGLVEVDLSIVKRDRWL